VNLGIILLLAPLAAVPVDLALDAGIGAVLRNLTRDDADLVYEAIRRAKPGGMGQVASEDLSEPPRVTLLEAMRLAADRDTVAAQYASDFQLVLQTGLPLLVAEHDFSKNWETAVIRLHLHLLATTPDTLIARKCGRATAESAARQARAVLEAGWPETSAGERLLEEFDAWLRGDGHRRNPGTTADLVAACLFAGFREGRLQPPPLFAQDA
jgi:triphosphoribosyl-dephospho-CoA synthase